MKIIITEEQYNKLYYLRRIDKIIEEGSDIIDNGDAFYGGVNFCYHYPTFKRFMEGFIYDIVEQYDSSYDVSNVGDFIDNHIGYENFVDMLMEEHGGKIRSFYNRKTKDC